jgi:hypothetical protein
MIIQYPKIYKVGSRTRNKDKDKNMEKAHKKSGGTGKWYNRDEFIEMKSID